MDKFTQKIAILNASYITIEKSLNNINKIFMKNKLIKQKIVLVKQFLNDLYKTILNELESEHINTEFIKIVKTIRKTDE